MSVRNAPGPLDHAPAGRSILPARNYRTQDAYDAELKAVFERHWLWAGFAHWVDQPGASRPVDVAGNPLLLARAKDGVLRVFHNVCRHRGFPLSDGPSTRGRLRCPYHHWTFDLDGSLCGTPYWDRTKGSGPRDQIREGLGLLPVRHAVWAGMIFVTFDENADPLTDLLEPLTDRWAEYDLETLHPAEERVYHVEANWKLVVENFLDMYHLPFVHGQVGSTSALLDVEDEPLSPRILGGYYPNGVAVKKSGQLGAGTLPHLGALTGKRLERQDLFCVFPNTLLFLQPDFFQVIAYQPVGPDRTLEHMALFVAAEAADDRFRATLERLCQVMFEVNDQDMPILRELQRARSSPAADRNHLLPHWDQMTARFQLLVAAALEATGLERAD